MSIDEEKQKEVQETRVPLSTFRVAVVADFARLMDEERS